jgi:glycosyltransferase involved in cell wall biosynthesis
VKKYSIIIPTAFAKWESILKPCLESIKLNTNMDESEVIVVANGCTDNTAVAAHEMGCEVVLYADPIGFPRAVNAGINVATGDFLVVLNNDVIIYAKNWLDLLTAPFADPTVGITGPMKERSQVINQEFILFFCACISRKVIDKIGLLDEIFSPGYSEDIDFCRRAADAGFKIVQVPDESHNYYAPSRRTGNFPIYHAGNETFKDVPDANLIHRNHAIIAERYGSKINIVNAQKLGEFVMDTELTWLARQAQKSKIVVEIGSWFGKTATAIADNLPDESVLYCIDTWKGSKVEQDNNHIQARDMDGDFAFDQFARNLWPHIASGKLRPLRMYGVHGAKLLRDKGIKADLVFIDAGHTYEEVKEDIHTFAPLVKEGGLMAGHDYGDNGFNPWPGVAQAVNEVLKDNFWREHATTFWITQNPPVRPRAIFDCMMFNNEYDILEKHLKTMWDVIDRFIVIEATITHSGKPKPLNFNSNIARFEKYLSKITYLVVEDSPPFNGNEDSAWIIERHQRDAMMRALTDCHDDDLIVVGDCDEIPNPQAVKNFTGDLAALSMDLFLFDHKVKAIDKWRHAKILTYQNLKKIGASNARYLNNIPDVVQGGQHLSWFGGVDAIIEKIHNTAHRNIDTDRFTDRAHIQNCIDKGLDLFDRDIKYEVVR